MASFRWYEEISSGEKNQYGDEYIDNDKLIAAIHKYGVNTKDSSGWDVLRTINAMIMKKEHIDIILDNGFQLDLDRVVGYIFLVCDNCCGYLTSDTDHIISRFLEYDDSGYVTSKTRHCYLQSLDDDGKTVKCSKKDFTVIDKAKSSLEVFDHVVMSSPLEEETRTRIQHALKLLEDHKYKHDNKVNVIDITSEV